jgi:hypothetical protein
LWCFSYSGYSAQSEYMRLTILAGLIVGVLLGNQSMHDAHVGHVASTARVHVRAPWYIAMSAGHSARTRGTLAGYLRETDLIVSS